MASPPFYTCRTAPTAPFYRRTARPCRSTGVEREGGEVKGEEGGEEEGDEEGAEERKEEGKEGEEEITRWRPPPFYTCRTAGGRAVLCRTARPCRCTSVEREGGEVEGEEEGAEEGKEGEGKEEHTEEAGKEEGKEEKGKEEGK